MVSQEEISVENVSFEPSPVGGFPDPFTQASSFSLDTFPPAAPAVAEVIETPPQPALEPQPPAASFAAPTLETRSYEPPTAEPTASTDAVSAMTREVIERIAWEIIPDLAEHIIREELERLKREKGVLR